MTEHIEPRQVETDDLTKVWSVTEFCARHRIDTEEQALLLKLSGRSRQHRCMDQTLDEATLSTAFFMQRARTWAGQVLSSG
ncbi:hypothetical protein ACOJBO_02985 [Rhizobium beringeri]